MFYFCLWMVYIHASVWRLLDHCLLSRFVCGLHGKHSFKKGFLPFTHTKTDLLMSLQFTGLYKQIFYEYCCICSLRCAVEGRSRDPHNCSYFENFSRFIIQIQLKSEIQEVDIWDLIMSAVFLGSEVPLIVFYQQTNHHVYYSNALGWNLSTQIMCRH